MVEGSSWRTGARCPTTTSRRSPPSTSPCGSAAAEGPRAATPPKPPSSSSSTRGRATAAASTPYFPLPHHHIWQSQALRCRGQRRRRWRRPRPRPPCGACSTPPSSATRGESAPRYPPFHHTLSTSYRGVFKKGYLDEALGKEVGPEIPLKDKDGKPIIFVGCLGRPSIAAEIEETFKKMVYRGRKGVE